MTIVDLTAPEVTLELQVETDWDFDVQWWQEDGTTPINISSFDAKLLSDFSDGHQTVLDLAPHSSLSQNVISVRVPAATTASIEPGRYVWFVVATSSTNETKGLARGKVWVKGD